MRLVLKMVLKGTSGDAFQVVMKMVVNQVIGDAW